jgi:hypothetical protein
MKRLEIHKKAPSGTLILIPGMSLSNPTTKSLRLWNASPCVLKLGSASTAVIVARCAIELP